MSYLQGQVFFHRQQWLSAAQQFAIACEGDELEFGLRRQSEYASGRCYEMLDKLDLALAAYRRVVALSPSWLPGRESLADLLEVVGRNDEAIENYREITRLHESPPAIWLKLVQSLILRNLVQREGSHDWDDVEEALDGARRFSVEAVEIAILQAEMLVARGRTADAAEVLTQARDANPQSAEAWAALVALAVRQADWPTADDLLAAAETQCGDQVALRIARGQLLVEADRPVDDQPGRTGGWRWRFFATRSIATAARIGRNPLLAGADQ